MVDGGAIATGPLQYDQNTLTNADAVTPAINRKSKGVGLERQLGAPGSASPFRFCVGTKGGSPLDVKLLSLFIGFPRRRFDVPSNVALLNRNFQNK
jgi:hypothetical protein